MFFNTSVFHISCSVYNFKAYFILNTGPWVSRRPEFGLVLMFEFSREHRFTGSQGMLYFAYRLVHGEHTTVIQYRFLTRFFPVRPWIFVQMSDFVYFCSNPQADIVSANGSVKSSPNGPILFFVSVLLDHAIVFSLTVSFWILVRMFNFGILRNFR